MLYRIWDDIQVDHREYVNEGRFRGCFDGWLGCETVARAHVPCAKTRQAFRDPGGGVGKMVSE